MNRKAASNGFPALFEMEVFHQYLNGGPYGAYSLTPLGETERLLKRYGWVGAQVEHRFAIYADLSRAKATLKYADSVSPALPDLLYAIQFRDADFARYTDVPMRSGCLLAFAGLPTLKTDEPLTLSVRPTVSEDDLAFIQTGAFICPVPTTEPPGPLWLTDRSGEKLAQVTQSNKGEVMIEADGLTSGFYKILKNKKIVYFFIKNDQLFRLPPTAVVSISVTQMLAALQKCTKNDDSPGTGSAYALPGGSLVFPSRKTVWRYDVFNHGGADPKAFKVEPAGPASELPPPAFFHAEGVKGPGGETSIAFESDCAISLQARPGQRFSLLRNHLPLIAELPTPSLEFSRATDRGGLCSNLFVYL